MKKRDSYGVFAECVTLDQAFVDFHIDHGSMMTFEDGDILLRHVRIPDAREVIGTASDQQIQISIKIETFASLRRQADRAKHFDRFDYFVQSKDVRLFQFVDRGDDQGVSTVATRCDDRIVMRNVKNLSNVFAMH